MSAAGTPDPPSADEAELAAIVAGVVERAGPGEQVEAYAGRGTSTTVRVHGGRVESLTSAGSAGVGIRVVVGGRQGFAHCGTLDPEVVAETLAEARDGARFAEVDPWGGLAERDGAPVVAQERWDPSVAAWSTDDKVALALDLEARVTGRDPRVRRVRTATYADGAGAAAVATSTGIAVAGRGTSCSLSVTALAEDGDELRQGVGYDVARGPDGVSVAVAADDALERATGLLGARPSPSRRLTVVLEPRVAAIVLGIAGGTLTGERVVKGRSPFAERRGEAIASPLVHLVDDPTDARSFGADDHDGEGLACRRNVLIDDGVLVGFLDNAWTGRRRGVTSTGSAVRSYRSTPGVGCQALAIRPGPTRPEALIGHVTDGLLVRSLSGLHSGVNAVSGDVSVGAEGLAIRNGVLAEPVKEVTLASTLQRLLLGIEAVGDDLEWLPGGTGAATLVIGDVTLSGS